MALAYDDPRDVRPGPSWRAARQMSLDVQGIGAAIDAYTGIAFVQT